MIGGKAYCADIFHRPETLRAYWPRLVRSYMLDALDAAPANSSNAAVAAKALLRQGAKAKPWPFRSPGLGADVRLQGTGVIGATLVHEGYVVHTALFRTDLGQPTGRTGALRMAARLQAQT